MWGALAVALGIGLAVGSPAGLVWADSTDAGPSDSPSGEVGQPGAEPGGPGPVSSDPGTDEPDPTDENLGDEEPEESLLEELPGSDGDVDESGSDGVPPSTEREPDNPPAGTGKEGNDLRDLSDLSDLRDLSVVAEPPEPRNETPQTLPGATVPDLTDLPEDDDPPADLDAPEAPATEFTALAVTQSEPTPEPTPSIFTALTDLVAPAFSAFLGWSPAAPADSPLAWLFAAFARRQVGADAVFAAAAVNEPPTVSELLDTPVAATGAISGRIVAVDPEGKALTYTVTSAPATGTLTFDSKTGAFTYTPTTAERILAATTPDVTETVAMTVAVSDGVNTVTHVVNIPIADAPIVKLADIEHDDAGAIVATATRAYVTNRSAGTVTVIDTATNTVIGTYNAGPNPDALAVKPDGTRLYVASRENNTVTVLNANTGAVVARISVTDPAALAVSQNGGSLYIVSGTGKLTRVNTAFNWIDATVNLPAGTRPTGVVVSPDNTAAYVIGTTPDGDGSVSVVRFSWFSSSATTFAELPVVPTSIAISPDNKRLYVGAGDGTLTVFDTGTRAVLGSYDTIGLDPITALTVSGDGTMVTALNQRGWILTVDPNTGELLRMFWTRPEEDLLAATPRMAATPDGRTLFTTNADDSVVYAVSLIGLNTAPAPGTPTFGTPNSWTGAISGAVNAADPDRDPLTYKLVTGPTRGSITLRSDGTFTYTPTASARHAAATSDEALKTDSFTVAVSDGRGGVTYTTVQVTIPPTNSKPWAFNTVGWPNTSTGAVSGRIWAGDWDWDKLTYTVTGAPEKGTVTVSSNGSYTYTPSAQARHEAARTGVPASAKKDTFTITVDDGHGGTVPITVTVNITPANAKPTGVTVADRWTNPNSGVVTGRLTVTDTDNDPLTYSVTAPKKGTLVVHEDGRFTYTPTDAARQAASAPNAGTSAKQESVTVTVNDGHGGTATYTLALAITPYGHVNAAPTNAAATVNDPTLAIGAVTGRITADDPERDALTYTLETAPAKGLVKIDSATGVFTYVPDVESRYAAAATPGDDTDTFTVTVSDGYGGTTTTTVVVSVAPPNPASSAIDQRATTVAVAAPEFWWYSDEDLAKGLDLLKESGVDTIRILIPWFLVEPEDDVWTWDRTDRIVYGARDRDIKVVAVLNHTPEWAVTPGTDPLVGAPADPAEYAEYVGMVATRYKGQVGAYEIWNEPNGQIFWQPKPNAADYTKLLQAAYPVIKEIDPDAVVIAGSIGAILDDGDWTTDSVRFLREMYEAGAAGYFDALSYHPYHYTTPFSTGGWLQGSPINQLNEIRELMTQHGDGNKKIWATEYGQPAALESDVNQAYYIADFLHAWRDLDYAGPAFIHTIRDLPPEINNPIEESFGLWRWDWSERITLSVVEEIIEQNKERINQPPNSV